MVRSGHSDLVTRSRSPQGVAHRIANIVNEELIFIEVQYGDYFGDDDGDDDIERLEDDFGRAG